MTTPNQDTAPSREAPTTEGVDKMELDEVREPLSIVQWPHPALTTVAEPVTQFDEKLRRLALAMIRICRERGGLGLAANQVGVPVRLFVAKDCYWNLVHAYVNPEIVFRSTEPEVVAEEACLSWPGHSAKVARTVTIRMRCQDTNGKWKEGAASDLTARCWQHEVDHLNGINLANPRTP